MDRIIPINIEKEIKKAGILKVILTSFSYFFVLWMVPLIILTILATITRIPVGSELFITISVFVIALYFAFDFIRIGQGQYSITMAVLFTGLYLVLSLVKVFNNSVSLIKFDEEIATELRRNLFPLNIMVQFS